MEVLIGEGVEFRRERVCQPAQRLRPAELEALLDPEPPAGGKPDRKTSSTGELKRLEELARLQLVVITRCITQSVSVPAATIRVMTGDLERLPALVSPAVPGAGPAAVAVELLGRVRAELPAIGELGEREQFLVSAWLTGLRSARTRRAYAGDVMAWLGWLAGRETGALAAGRVHLDLCAATQLDAGVAESSVRRRLSALSSFYRYCAAHDLIGRVHRGRRPVAAAQCPARR